MTGAPGVGEEVNTHAPGGTQSSPCLIRRHAEGRMLQLGSTRLFSKGNARGRRQRRLGVWDSVIPEDAVHQALSSSVEGAVA